MRIISVITSIGNLLGYGVSTLLASPTGIYATLELWKCEGGRDSHVRVMAQDKLAASDPSITGTLRDQNLAILLFLASTRR